LLHSRLLIAAFPYIYCIIPNLLLLHYLSFIAAFPIIINCYIPVYYLHRSRSCIYYCITYFLLFAYILYWNKFSINSNESAIIALIFFLWLTQMFCNRCDFFMKMTISCPTWENVCVGVFSSYYIDFLLI